MKDLNLSSSLSTPQLSQKGKMILRCTAKLLKELGASKADLADNIPQDQPLNEWYANLFFIVRKKCVIFTNTATLFTFIVFDVDRSQIRDIGNLFRKGLGCALLDEDFDGTLIQRLVDRCCDVHLAKTRDKSVIGVMVDHVKNARWMIEDNGGLETCDRPRIIKQLNRTPLLTQKFFCSIKEFKRIFSGEAYIT